MCIIVISEPEWTKWSDWTICSATCGGGETTRARVCQEVDGKTCPGAAIEKNNCNEQACPGKKE